MIVTINSFLFLFLFPPLLHVGELLFPIGIGGAREEADMPHHVHPLSYGVKKWGEGGGLFRNTLGWGCIGAVSMRDLQLDGRDPGIPRASRCFFFPSPEAPSPFPPFSPCFCGTPLGLRLYFFFKRKKKRERIREGKGRGFLFWGI